MRECFSPGSGEKERMVCCVQGRKRAYSEFFFKGKTRHDGNCYCMGERKKEEKEKERKVFLKAVSEGDFSILPRLLSSGSMEVFFTYFLKGSSHHHHHPAAKGRERKRRKKKRKT